MSHPSWDSLGMFPGAVFVAGIFSLIATVVSAVHILQHAMHYDTPHIQRHIQRILLMVPIYAVDSFLGLAVPASQIYLDMIRDAYESFR